MLTLVAFLTLAQQPSKLVIWGGGVTADEAKASLQRFEARDKQLPFLELEQGYPRILETQTVAGLKPGFFVVALGVCASESEPTFKLLDALEPAVYTRDVSMPVACPRFSTPVEPEYETFTLNAVEVSKASDGLEYTVVAVTSKADGAEAEVKEWWVAVQVRRKGAVVAEEQFSSLGSFSELLQRVVASAKGVEFKEREVNPNCGGMGTRYTETIRSHLVRFDGSRLADVARTVSSSSGRCN